MEKYCNSNDQSLVFLLDKENVSKMLPLFIVVLLAVFAPPCSSWDGVVVTQADYNALRAVKSSFVDPHGVLRSWNDSGVTACSGGWLGIKCVKGQVIAIQLPWRGLGGTLSPKVGQIASLRKLSLHDNRIGGRIPPSIGLLPDLRGLVLFNNLLVGLIPPELGNCPSLRNLDLSSNSLSGFVPASLFNSSHLYRLNLSRNSLSGPVPVALTSSVSVTFVDLSFNNLSGSIPDTWGIDPYLLQSLFLDHNLISGAMPASLVRLDKLEEISLSNNRVTGVIPDDIGSLLQLSVLDLSKNRLQSRIPDSVDMLQNLTRLDLSDNELVGPIPSSLADLQQLEFFNVSYNNLSGAVPLRLARRFNSSSFQGNLLLCGFDAASPCAAPAPPPATSDIERPPETESHGRRLSNRDIILIVVGTVLVFLLLICCILLICLIRRRSGSRSEKSAPSGGIATTARGAKSGEQDIEAGGEAGGKLVHFDGPLAFTADDLLCATAEIMGKSTYGTVYRATLEDGSQVAVKRLREKIAKGQKEFETEVNSLGRIRHPNLLPLRAYYIGPKGEKLLVFDYMPKGSLSSFLHARGPDTAINWPTRLNIAIGVAQGINHLHTQLNMVHGNLTASNVLLDESTDARVSDYGLSRLMTTAANANVIATAGAMGYRAPELSKVKKASTKTDVYSLGVILLEFLAGKSPGEVMNGVDLPQWVASNVQEEKTKEVFDLELVSDAAAGEDLLNCLKLALHCVDPAPGARPDAEQVLQRLLEMKRDIVEVGSSAHDEEVGGDPSNE